MRADSNTEQRKSFTLFSPYTFLCFHLLFRMQNDVRFGVTKTFSFATNQPYMLSAAINSMDEQRADVFERNRVGEITKGDGRRDYLIDGGGKEPAAERARDREG